MHGYQALNEHTTFMKKIGKVSVGLHAWFSFSKLMRAYCQNRRFSFSVQNAEMNSVESEKLKSAAEVLPSAALTQVNQVKVSGNNVNRYSNDSGVVDVDLVRSPEMTTTLLTVVDGQRTSSANVGTRSRPHSVHSGECAVYTH